MCKLMVTVPCIFGYINNVNTPPGDHLSKVIKYQMCKLMVTVLCIFGYIKWLYLFLIKAIFIFNLYYGRGNFILHFDSY